MHAIQVFKRISRLVAARGDLVLDLGPCAEAIETIVGTDMRTHIVLGASAARSILTDEERFAPASIAESIRRLSEHTGIDAIAIHRFLIHNPMQTDRPAHSALRRSYASAYAHNLRRHAGQLRGAANAHFTNLERHRPTALAHDVIAPGVDAILQILLSDDDIAVEWITRIGGGAVMLEYLHHPRKLATKSAQLQAFLDDFAARSGDSATDPVREAIISSYVLQGREPIVGAIGAFLHDWLASPPQARESQLDSIDAAQLFARTAPVNYIGRSARVDTRVAGQPILAGDHILLMLPWINGDAMARGQRTMAFGAGAHACAGQALALALADTFLDGLREAHCRIDWSAVECEPPVAGVFRQYGAHP